MEQSSFFLAKASFLNQMHSSDQGTLGGAQFRCALSSSTWDKILLTALQQLCHVGYLLQCYSSVNCAVVQHHQKNSGGCGVVG